MKAIIANKLTKVFGSLSAVDEISFSVASGEVFGFYVFTGKTASIIGPLIWGSIVWGFTSFGLMKYRIAIISLLLFLLIGLIILQRRKND